MKETAQGAVSRGERAAAERSEPDGLRRRIGHLDGVGFHGSARRGRLDAGQEIGARAGGGRRPRGVRPARPRTPRRPRASALNSSETPMTPSTNDIARLTWAMCQPARDMQPVEVQRHDGSSRSHRPRADAGSRVTDLTPSGRRRGGCRRCPESAQGSAPRSHCRRVRCLLHCWRLNVGWRRHRRAARPASRPARCAAAAARPAASRPSPWRGARGRPGR